MGLEIHILRYLGGDQVLYRQYLASLPSIIVDGTRLLLLLLLSLHTRKWELKEMKGLTPSYRYATGLEWMHGYPRFSA